MAQFEFVAWLVRWLFEHEEFEFDWDAGNASKSAEKHHVEVENAEQVFRNRDLSVCFTVREGKIRVISIRPMSQRERREYAALREK